MHNIINNNESFDFGALQLCRLHRQLCRFHRQLCGIILIASKNDHNCFSTELLGLLKNYRGLRKNYQDLIHNYRDFYRTNGDLYGTSGDFYRVPEIYTELSLTSKEILRITSKYSKRRERGSFLADCPHLPGKNLLRTDYSFKAL